MKVAKAAGFEGIELALGTDGEMIPRYKYASDQIIYNTSSSMERILNEKF